MISVTTVIQYIHKCKTQIQVDYVVQVRMVFLTFGLQFFDTRRETQFFKVLANHFADYSMLTIPNS